MTTTARHYIAQRLITEHVAGSKISGNTFRSDFVSITPRGRGNRETIYGPPLDKMRSKFEPTVLPAGNLHRVQIVAAAASRIGWLLAFNKRSFGNEKSGHLFSQRRIWRHRH
jgi:hypothetical protein